MKLTNNWELFYCDKPIDIKKLKYVTYFKNVRIPTLFELEIFKNGLLGDPYFSLNNWKYKKYEGYHQYYVKHFDSNCNNKILKLNGVDTISEVFVNGELIGKTDNCFLEFDFQLCNLKKKDNVLLIHILPCVIEGKKHDFSDIRQCAKYNFEGLYIRKPASSFGWDILPRTPLGGIYKSVELVDTLPLIKNFRILPKEVTKNRAILNFKFEEYKNISYKVSGKCRDSVFEVMFKSNGSVEVPFPYLWTIRGYGEQNLYNLKIEAVLHGKVVETKTIKYGIRKVELKRTSTVCKNGSFEFYINDEKVFLLGSNWVPVDAIRHIDNKRAVKALNMLLDLGCNAIRIWGGGTYETEKVYSLCDELGIFVWQDFMMGCATYPQNEDFQKVIENEVFHIVNKLVNYCSICLWAGDNENDAASSCWAINKKDPNENVLTRKIIPFILNKLDGTRPYLPSSPYIDKYAYLHNNEILAEDHLWGPRDYFKGEYYKNVYPYFTSETGYHGLNSPKSLKKFMKNPWPLFDAKGNPKKEYMCHGVTVEDDLNSPYAYRTKLMADQVNTLFINKFDNLNDFSLASQISQAEALKFFIEKMRRDTDRNGGIIWWNLLDGWPQVSDAIVDYYFNKKLAYNYVKLSQQPILLFGFEEDGVINFYCSSLVNHDEKIFYSIIDEYTGQSFGSGTLFAKAKSSFVFKTIPNDKKHHFLFIEYSNSKKERFFNSFHTNIINIEYNRYVQILKKLKNLKI